MSPTAAAPAANLDDTKASVSPRKQALHAISAAAIPHAAARAQALCQAAERKSAKARDAIPAAAQSVRQAAERAKAAKGPADVDRATAELQAAQAKLGRLYVAERAAWHYSRAARAAVGHAERCATCGIGKIRLRVVSLDTGEIVDVPERCNSKLCHTCQERRAKKLQARIWQASRAVHAAELAKGREPRLLTLTVRHSGQGPAVDAGRLQAAWRIFRADWHARFHFAFKFFRALEVSGGSDGDGHAHFHAVIWIQPDTRKDESGNETGVDYGTLQSWWRKALTCADSLINVDCGPSPGNLRFDKIRSADGVIRYVTKACRYVAKNAIAFHNIDNPESAAELLEWLYGKRQIAASVGFFSILLPRFALFELCTDPDNKRPSPFWWRQRPQTTGPP